MGGMKLYISPTKLVLIYPVILITLTPHIGRETFIKSTKSWWELRVCHEELILHSFHIL